MMRAAKYNASKEALELVEIPVPSPSERQVLIKVHSAGVNRIDLLMLSAIPVVGMEVAGTIVERGSGCQSTLKEGDEVFALLSDGGYAEYVSVDERHVLPRPQGGLSFDELGGIAEAWLTGYQLLHFVGQVKKGQTVLVHAAGSGVGHAVLQMARVAGAKIIATAGSAEKLEVAKRFGADFGINYKEQKFGEEVQRLTEGRGADLILDCVGESHAEENVKSLAMDGTWVVYGTLGGPNAPPNFIRSILMKRANIKGTTLRSRSTEYKADLVSSFSKDILPLISSGSLKVEIDRVFDFEEVNDALQHMKGNKNIGKIILRMEKTKE